MSITGDPYGDPTKVGVALVDDLTSKEAVVGILAALRAREINGLGQPTSRSTCSRACSDRGQSGVLLPRDRPPPHRMDNAHPSLVAYETLPCADSDMTVAYGNDKQFADLARRSGSRLSPPPPPWHERDPSGERRFADRRFVRGPARAPRAHWVSELTSVGVPAGRVQDLAGGMALAERLGLEPTVAIGDGAPQVRHPVR